MKDKDYDYCPDTLNHKHAWYQTTFAKECDDNDELDGVRYSHACKCGQWRVGVYEKSK